MLNRATVTATATATDTTVMFVSEYYTSYNSMYVDSFYNNTPVIGFSGYE